MGIILSPRSFMGMMGMGIGGNRGGDGGVIPGHPRTRCHPESRGAGPCTLFCVRAYIAQAGARPRSIWLPYRTQVSGEIDRSSVDRDARGRLAVALGSLVIISFSRKEWVSFSRGRMFVSREEETACHAIDERMEGREYMHVPIDPNSQPRNRTNAPPCRAPICPLPR